MIVLNIRRLETRNLSLAAVIDSREYLFQFGSADFAWLTVRHFKFLKRLFAIFSARDFAGDTKNFLNVIETKNFCDQIPQGHSACQKLFRYENLKRKNGHNLIEKFSAKL